MVDIINYRAMLLDQAVGSVVHDDVDVQEYLKTGYFILVEPYTCVDGSSSKKISTIDAGESGMYRYTITTADMNSITTYATLEALHQYHTPDTYLRWMYLDQSQIDHIDQLTDTYLIEQANKTVQEMVNDPHFNKLIDHLFDTFFSHEN